MGFFLKVVPFHHFIQFFVLIVNAIFLCLLNQHIVDPDLILLVFEFFLFVLEAVYFFLVNIVPVDIRKPLVVFDFVEPISGSVPFKGVPYQQFFKEITALNREFIDWHHEGSRFDVLIQAARVVGEIWRHTDQELVKNHTDTVPVDRFPVRLVFKHFRGKVCVGPAE